MSGLEDVNLTINQVRQLYRNAQYYGLSKEDVEQIEDVCNLFFDVLEPIQAKLKQEAP